jgi:hypothetical protein
MLHPACLGGGQNSQVFQNSQDACRSGPPAATSKHAIGSALHKHLSLTISVMTQLFALFLWHPNTCLRKAPVTTVLIGKQQQRYVQELAWQQGLPSSC